MKRFLTALLTCSMVLSMAQVNFSATDDTASIMQRARSANFTIGDTATNTEVGTDVYAMYTEVSGNEVSMYPIMSFGTAGTYAKSHLPEGMNAAEVEKLISFAKDKGFAKINSAINASGEDALTDAEDLDIAITTAIWGKFRYNMGSSTKFLDFDRNANLKYVNAAKYIINSYSSYTVPETTFEVNTANIKKVAHSDGSYKYYGPFSFTSNNASIACAETPAGVEIVNSSWMPVDKNTLSSGTNYYVAIPNTSAAPSNAIKLSLQYVEKDLAVYGNSNAKFVGVVNAPFKLNETFTIGAYATAKIYDKPGNVINVRSDDGVYDKNIIVGPNGVGYAENLSIGNYTAKQIASADGSILTTTPKTFSVTSTSDLITLKFDSVNLFGNLQISNLSNTGSTLNGGQVAIYCTDGTLYKTVTMQDIVSISLPIGEYYAIQTSAVNGYQLDSAKHTFTVNPNKLTEVKIVNAPIGTAGGGMVDAGKGQGSINVIAKKDGYVTNIYDVTLQGPNGLSLRCTPIEGTALFKGLPEGTYRVALANTPSGYSIAVKDVMLSQSNIRETVILNTSADSTVREGVLGLLAVDEFNYVIPNITFDVYSKDGDRYIGTAKTDANGYCTIPGITTGNYKIVPKDDGDHKVSESTIFISRLTGITVKVVMPRVNDKVDSSNKLPAMATDECLDNYNTGVTTSVKYNDFDKDGSIDFIDGEKFYIVEDDEDFDGRARIIVKKPNGKVMEGVSISIYNHKDKKVFTEETNEDGELLLAGLEPKKEYKIKLKESTLKDYYAPAEKDLTFTTKSDKTTKVVVELSDKENEVATTGNKTRLEITTVDSTGKRLDASYTVYNSAGVAVVSGKTVNGIATFETDEIGSYTVKQTSVQNGYALEQEPYNFTVTGEGKTITVTVTNSTGNGVSANGLASLSGFVFEDKNGNNTFDAGEGYTGAKVTISSAGKSISVYSGANGTFTVTDLPAGTYTVQAEINGATYVQRNVSTNGAINSKVDANGKASVSIDKASMTDFGIGFRFANGAVSNGGSGVPDVPKTGEEQNNNMFFIGVSIMCLAGIIVLNKKNVKC